MSRTRRVRRRPINCGQDLRGFEGYRILKVQSDKEDLNARIILGNNSGQMVKLYLNNLCLNGTMIRFKDNWQHAPNGNTKKKASPECTDTVKKGEARHTFTHTKKAQ